MSTNAGKWFYQEPENQAFLISERLNSTFWQARIVGAYWRCDRAEPPYHAKGYSGDHMLELEWVPGEWLALKVPAGADPDALVKAVATRIMAFPATLTYGNDDDQQVYEWHCDGGDQRWSEVQGTPQYKQPQRL